MASLFLIWRGYEYLPQIDSEERFLRTDADGKDITSRGGRPQQQAMMHLAGSRQGAYAIPSPASLRLVLAGVEVVLGKVSCTVYIL